MQKGRLWGGPFSMAHGRQPRALSRHSREGGNLPGGDLHPGIKKGPVYTGPFSVGNAQGFRLYLVDGRRAFERCPGLTGPTVNREN